MITGFSKDGVFIGNSVRDFKASVGAFVAQTAREHLKMQINSCVMLLNSLKTATDFGPGTPVDTRWASNNWWFAIGDTCPTDTIGEYPGEGVKLAPKNPPKGILNSAKPFKKMWVYNNVPYIEALEDGHSKQAPMGFAYNALQALEAWLKDQQLKMDNP